MDITPRDATETKTLGHGQRISIAIGMLATLIPAVLTAVGGLDFITAHLPLLLTGVGTFVSGGITAYVAIRRMRIDAGKVGLILLLLLPMFLWTTGCSTVNKDNIEAGAGWAEKYYNQPTVAKIMEMTSTNGTGKITIENISTLALYTPVPPKSIIPRDPTWYEGVFDSLKTIAPWVFMGWAIHDGAFGGDSTTTTTTSGGTP